MNSTIDSTLLTAPYQLNIYLGSFLWIIGNTGCIGNMIVFRSQSFRHRAYSIYLFFQAMSDFIYFDFVLLTRILQKGFQIPIMIRYDIICKLRQFVSFWGNQVSFTLFTFATIDRLLSTQRENKYRQWSNRMSLAYKLTIGCLLFWFVFIGHRLVLYSAKNSSCGGLDGFYSDFDTYLEVVCVGICPPLVTSVLAYLLIRNVRDAIHRRINPTNQSTPVVRRTALQKMDSQLTLMLILQSFFAMVTYFPYAGELIYTNVTQYYPKSSLQNAQEKVLVEFIHITSYTFFASSFYVSMISNNGFRRECKKFFCRQNRINVTDITQNIVRTKISMSIQPPLNKTSH